MAAPRTWITGELVTASMLNEFVRDHFNVLAKKGIAIGIGDFAGAPITTGIRAYLPIPWSMLITAWTLISDVSGSIVLDVWRAAYPTVPTVANTIAGSEKPTLSAAQTAQDLALSTWDTDIDAGDIIAVKVDSTGGVIKQATLTLTGVALELT